MLFLVIASMACMFAVLGYMIYVRGNTLGLVTAARKPPKKKRRKRRNRRNRRRGPEDACISFQFLGTLKKENGSFGLAEQIHETFIFTWLVNPPIYQ